MQEAHEQPHADLKLGATVGKFRRMAAGAGSAMEMDRTVRHAYADAVEKAIRAKHSRLHARPTPPTTPGWYNPPSVTRLLHYENPIRMAGDPDWETDCGCGNLRYYEKHRCDKWDLRQKAVYAATMECKQAAE